jgi:hypothetical protein
MEHFESGTIDCCDLWRMPSSVMLRGVAPIRADVSEGRIASIIRVTIIDELVTTLLFLHSLLQLLVTANVTPIGSIIVALMIVATCSSETSDLTRVTHLI